MGGYRWAVAIVLAIGATVVIAAAVLFGPLLRSGDTGRAGIDATRATAIALDYFAGAHGAGATVANVRVLSVALGTDEQGRPVWKVNVAGAVTERGQTFTYTSAM